jgi:hypothetical protein
MTATVVQGGLLILPFLLGIGCCACFCGGSIYRFGDLLFVWFMSVLGSIVIGGWKRGKWSLLSAPIALFPLGYLVVACTRGACL